MVSFISLAFVAAKLQMFKCFRGNAASMNHHFGRFLSSFSPRYGTSLLKLRPEVASHKTKTFSSQYFKIKCLRRNGKYPKLKVLVIFWVQLTPGKSKILPETKIFTETKALCLSNDTSSRPQINHRILIKLIKKIHFGG